ncbi:hypothetical protein VMCG_03072 [Cytospora schulzeri]|uniref:Uncharacterized protein n=1 Tax=Cytospora schulzeri TaxID=448051 RepID=A0A423WY28_9PEZI|nr:hypothetical protein VMCG_03072 [Valsa malicola]
MRLLDTTSLKFKEFFEDNIPSYAILSHTWGRPDEEVSFQDMGLDPQTLSDNRRYGYTKIVNTCRLARNHGLQYAWVDTCCIDKSSSAELAEAINSMFRWYEKAKICYVYLVDVTPQKELQEGLKSCRWITRGWTLQELIAPRECQLFDSKWKYRGRKTELKEMFAVLTGVPASVLANEKLPREFSVAQKMSWAAKRTTTRSEDMAYCLLGLFGIHMPMIYGEGEMAFHRLQEEIIRRSNDPTIFAWNPADGGALDFMSILAPSPAAFEHSRSFEDLITFHGPEFALTNKGLKIANTRIAATKEDKNKQSRKYLVVLDGGATGNTEFAGIHLRKVDGNLFCRINKPIEIFSQPGSLQADELTELYVADFCTFHITRSVVLERRRSAVQIVVPNGAQIVHTTPQRLWDYEDYCFLAGLWGADLVQWVEIEGHLRDQKVALIILCDRRADNGRGTPVLSIFEKRRFIGHWNYLAQYSRTHLGDPLTWSKIGEDFPALLNHTESTSVPHKSVALKVSVSVAKRMVSIREGVIDMYQARLIVDEEKGAEGRMDSHNDGPSYHLHAC